MNKIAKRLYIVVAIVLAAFGVSHMVAATTKSPEVERPGWSLNDLPFQLGDWRGEKKELDPRIAAATGAQVIVNREYRDEAGHTVSLHAAMFDDAREGVYHSPMNCYRAAGWKETGQILENLDVADDLPIAVSLTTWEKNDEKIAVVYWFQLGKHVMYSRLDLGWSIRWAMRGQPTWPVLVKIMVQAPLKESENSKAITLGFTKELAKWLNRADHRRYLDRWPGI